MPQLITRYQSKMREKFLSIREGLVWGIFNRKLKCNPWLAQNKVICKCTNRVSKTWLPILRLLKFVCSIRFGQRANCIILRNSFKNDKSPATRIFLKIIEHLLQYYNDQVSYEYRKTKKKSHRVLLEIEK